jgi:hypothetical protein
MADLENLGYTSILDMNNDEAIDLLRQIRLSRRTLDKKVTKVTTKQTMKKLTSSIDASMAAELLKLLGGDE